MRVQLRWSGGLSVICGGPCSISQPPRLSFLTPVTVRGRSSNRRSCSVEAAHSLAISDLLDPVLERVRTFQAKVNFENATSAGVHARSPCPFSRYQFSQSDCW